MQIEAPPTLAEVLAAKARGMTLRAYRDAVAAEHGEVPPEERHRIAALEPPASAGERHEHYEPPEGEPKRWLNERVDEQDEQAAVVKVLRAVGCTVRNLSQARATKQDPGLADLWVVHRPSGMAWWWETKRQVGGRHSAAQVQFRADCGACSVGYGTGDRYDVRRYLVRLGLATMRADGEIEPRRADG